MLDRAQSNPGVIEKTVLIRCSPAALFKALTDADALTEWFCDKADCDARVGGVLQAQWSYGKDARRGRAVFRRLEADACVTLEWINDSGTASDGRILQTLEFTIRSRRDGSELRVRDEGIPLPDADALSDFEEGWISVLRDLKEYCESLERAARSRK